MTDPVFKLIKNDDSRYVKDLKKRIKANNGFCPSQMTRDKDTKCPCKAYREQGECYCGMYIKVPVYEEEV